MNSSELNTDSIGLIRVLALLANPTLQLGTEEDNTSFFSVSDVVELSDDELNALYRKSNLLKKIIRKFPEEAKSIGYVLKDENGNIINKNDELLLSAFLEASIFARLYGTAFLLFDYEVSYLKQAIQPKEKVISWRIEFDLIAEGDFFTRENPNTNSKEYFHKSKVYVFYGEKTYKKGVTPYQKQYADSIITGLAISMRNYFVSSDLSRKILTNLSYFKIGIKNLGNTLRTEKGRQEIQERMLSIQVNRSVSRTIPYDKDNEILEFVSQTLSGIPEILSDLKAIFASETEYPINEVFEEASRQNLGSGIQNQLIARMLWAERCVNWVTKNWLENYELFFTRNQIKGSVEIPYIVKMTELEKAELQKIGSERLKNLIDSKVVFPEEGRTGYKGDQYTLNIDLQETNSKTSVSNLDPSLGNDSGVSEDAIRIGSKAEWDQLVAITIEDLDRVAQEALING